MINPFLNVLKEVISKVKEKNQADPNVKTADASVFDKIRERFENAGRNTGAKLPKGEDTVFEDVKQQVDECQVENEADPNVETADKSVFEDMMKELEELRAKVKDNEAQGSTPTVESNVSDLSEYAPKDVPSSVSDLSEYAPNVQPDVVTPSPAASSDIMAMTNSMGGSLELRTGPDMGAPMAGKYVPDSSLLKVIEYSENSINLDGKNSRFVLVEYNGERGWLLEAYLNFN